MTKIAINGLGHMGKLVIRSFFDLALLEDFDCYFFCRQRVRAKFDLAKGSLPN